MIYVQVMGNVVAMFASMERALVVAAIIVLVLIIVLVQVDIVQMDIVNLNRHLLMIDKYSEL